MSIITNFIKCAIRTPCIRNTFSLIPQSPKQFYRGFADTPKIDITTKQIVVRGTENEERVRVRRARPSDVPRILRFVREHANTAWPGLLAPPPSSSIVLCDYVARTLAQGHSMIAEQMEARRGWSRIRGLTLATTLSPWDPIMLERFAKCVRCARSRRLLHFAAHCMRAPQLHDKYRVHNILQVLLMVPIDSQKSIEIVETLAKNSIIRGKDMGYPLLRFDVTDGTIAKSLEESLQLKNEWKLSYEVLPYIIKEREDYCPQNESKENFVAVYTAFPKACTGKDKK